MKESDFKHQKRKSHGKTSHHRKVNKAPSRAPKPTHEHHEHPHPREEDLTRKESVMKNRARSIASLVLALGFVFGLSTAFEAKAGEFMPASNAFDLSARASQGRVNFTPSYRIDTTAPKADVADSLSRFDFAASGFEFRSDFNAAQFAASNFGAKLTTGDLGVDNTSSFANEFTAAAFQFGAFTRSERKQEFATFDFASSFDTGFCGFVEFRNV